VIAGPAVLAGVLGLIGLSGRSLGFDEGATVSIAAQHGAALWRAIAHDGGNMSAYYLFMHVLIGVFGNGLVVLRLPSAIATVLTVALIAVIAQRLFADRRVSAAAGVLAAVSLPLLYWGQAARARVMAVAMAGRPARLRPGGAPGWSSWPR
jgi:mannosyltransferase